jgi:protein TonB
MYKFILVASFSFITIFINAQDKIQALIAAEEMPYAAQCENSRVNSERIKCTKAELASFYENNLIYPKSAKEEKIEGSVEVGFIVDSKGMMKDLKIVKSANKLLEEEALRIFKLLSESSFWIPGKNNGEYVDVKLKETLIFKLK